MSRRGRLDAVVVGGGVVGCTAALALARAGLDVALLEAKAPPAWTPERRDLRVYAFAPDNAALLDSFGTWSSIRDARATPASDRPPRSRGCAADARLHRRSR